jgi:hypothetical protein
VAGIVHSAQSREDLDDVAGELLQDTGLIGGGRPLSWPPVVTHLVTQVGYMYYSQLAS